MSHRCKIFFLSFLLCLIFSVVLPKSVLFSDTIDELRVKIAEREDAIKALEIEIAKTQADIDNTRGQQKTLANTIKTLDNERKKLLSEIKVTTQKINARELEIESLGIGIQSKTLSISNNKESLAEMLRVKDILESQSTLTALLNNSALSDYWDAIHDTILLSATIENQIEQLKSIKDNLETDMTEAESIRRELSNLSRRLSGQKEVADGTLSQKQKILTATKNKESEYQKILNQQVAIRNTFEKELSDFESQLNFAIDPSGLPTTGAGVLGWPLDKIKITQYFGNTDFAATHPQLYSGGGHNGIDLGAAIGTSVKSASDGVVKGAGNTDTACPGAAYGKWILVEHNNGLSTLYAHLSVISVSAGSVVKSGDTIGLSGNTGYSTGPHLHFTVYATQGVRIMDRKSKVCNGVYNMPVAYLKAYLNPLSYL